MSSMAQDAIEMGLDECVAPDGREWCDSIYERPDINKEIWGKGDDCENFQVNKISLDGPREYESYKNYDTDEYIEDSKQEIEIKMDKSYYILENLITRIEIENLSLSYITNIELESLKYALGELVPKKTVSSKGHNKYDDDIDF